MALPARPKFAGANMVKSLVLTLATFKIGKKFAECVIFKITNNWLKVNYYDILLLYSFSIKIKKKSFWGYYKGIAKK